MGRGLRHALLALLVFFLFALLAAPGVTAGQATIDDTNGDSVTGAIPAYSGKWEEENQCSFCSAFQQFQQSFNKDWLKDGTWHASRTPGATVTLQFTGTSLQVFFFVPLVGEHTACAFSLDDEPAWNLDLQPTNAPPFLSFNHQVFSVSDLENIEHTLVISVSALVVFDYATYDFDDATTSQPSQLSSSPAPSPSTSPPPEPEPASSSAAPSASPTTQSLAPGPSPSNAPSTTSSTLAPASGTSTTGLTSISLSGGEISSLSTGSSPISPNPSPASNTAQSNTPGTTTGSRGGSGPGSGRSNSNEAEQTASATPSTSFGYVSGLKPPSDYTAPYAPPAPSPSVSSSSNNLTPGGSSAGSGVNGGSGSVHGASTSASSRPSVPIGAIVGGVLGGLLLLLVTALVVWRRRRRARPPPSAEFLQPAALGKRFQGSLWVAAGASTGGIGVASLAEKGGPQVNVAAASVAERDAAIVSPAVSPVPTIAAVRRAIQANAASPLARLSAGTDLPDLTDARGRAALLRDEVARTLSAYHAESGSSERSSAASPTPLARAEQLQVVEATATSAPEPPRARFERTSLVSSLNTTWAI